MLCGATAGRGKHQEAFLLMRCHFFMLWALDTPLCRDTPPFAQFGRNTSSLESTLAKVYQNKPL